MNSKLAAEDLYSLEQYAKIRPAFRERVMAHKKNRKVYLGENVMLVFEDRLTMQYQIQEMLRAERIFEESGIREELDAYNPLIPDGRNWKATLMIEFPDVEERRQALKALIGIEERVWVRVGSGDPVFAIADEDLARTTPEKTSSVHFLRFDVTEAMVEALRAGAALSIGIDHRAYPHALEPVPDAVRASLLGDLAA